MNYPDIESRKAIINGGRLADPLPKIQDVCCAPVPTAQEEVEQAQQELARLKELVAHRQDLARDQSIRDVIDARIANELALAEATGVLLAHIRQLVVNQVRTVNGSKLLSHFIKELQPLAQTYGVKIVKIGNGELATLVLASAK